MQVEGNSGYRVPGRHPTLVWSQGLPPIAHTEWRRAEPPPTIPIPNHAPSQNQRPRDQDPFLPALPCQATAKPHDSPLRTCHLRTT